MAERLLITVAPTGAETSKADCPQLPTTPEEIAATAAECEAAGAAMIHLHVRDGEHAPTLDQSLLREWVAAVRESSNLVVQLSSGGSVHDPLDKRLEVLDAEPDSCSLTMGTTNFGDDVFSNPWPFVCELYQLAQERRIAPEFELFDLGQVHALGRLLNDLRPARTAARRTCDFVMGVPGGMPGTRRRAGRRRRRAAARGDVLVGHRDRAHDAVGRPGVAVQGRPPAGRAWRTCSPSRGACPSRPTASSSSARSSSVVWRSATPMTPAECRVLLGI